jgi:N utilization substance protein A
MEIKSLEPIISMIAEERGIPKEKVLESLEYAIAAAYKKDYGKKGQVIRAKIDLKKGEVSFWQVKQVVDKDMVYFDKKN